MTVVRGAVTRYWVLLALLGGWWAVVAVNDFNQIVMPYPQDVLVAIVRERHEYLTALVPTLALSLGGLAAGLTAGGVCAVLVWSSRIVAGVLTPMALLLNSVPVVAMIPVLARVLGYGQTTVFVVTAIICFLPAFVFVGARLAAPPASLGDVYTVLGAGRGVRLRRTSCCPMPCPGSSSLCGSAPPPRSWPSCSASTSWVPGASERCSPPRSPTARTSRPGAWRWSRPPCPPVFSSRHVRSRIVPPRA